MATPSGASGFADLDAAASEATVDGETIRIASVDDLIRMKQAAGREKDLGDIGILKAIRGREGAAE
jgi:hypothetical protein